MNRRHPISILLCLTILAISGQAQSPQKLREADRAFNMALRLEQAGNAEQALTIYYRLVEEHPANLRYFQRLKYLLRNTGQQVELLQAIHEHLKSYPDDIQSIVEAGDAQLALEQKDLALQTWEGILARYPDNTSAQHMVLSHLFINNLVDEGRVVLESIRNTRRDTAFFSLDMGRLYASRLSYDLAADEYLLYLSANPKAVRVVRDQFLRFPAEPEIIAMLRAKLGRSSLQAALRILADMEFKHRHFGRVVTLYGQLGAAPKEQLELALNLKSEGEFDLSQRLLEQLLNSPNAEALYEKAILELAGLYLDRTQIAHVQLPLSGFYDKNQFFTTPFVKVAGTDITQLRQAMALYDSLVTTWRNPQARLRLSNIKYRILDDFDGAIGDLEALLDDSAFRSYYPEIFLRLVDLWIAKGDLERSEAILHRSGPYLKNREQLNRLELKAIDLLFLSGRQDTLIDQVGGLMAALGPEDPAFNDLMELSGLAKRFRDWPEAYRDFIQSERLLRQNRRSEALARLGTILQMEPTSITPIIQYRMAHLHVLRGDYYAAENLGLTITGDSEFNELGLLLAAEIADYLVGDANLASQRYLEFLDSYPLSVHHDAVRLRYRTLNPQFN